VGRGPQVIARDPRAFLDAPQAGEVVAQPELPPPGQLQRGCGVLIFDQPAPTLGLSAGRDRLPGHVEVQGLHDIEAVASDEQPE
jgi:hypothetical protein